MKAHVGTAVRRKRAAPCYLFEGVWWRTREIPQVLPFFQALSTCNGGLSLSHRTIRTADDLQYWLKRIPSGERALVYIACHGTGGNLEPVDGRSKLKWEDVVLSFRGAKRAAIEFVHFSACEIIEESDRRRRLEQIAEASGARWVSGYARPIDWLTSMLFDIAVIADLYLPFYHDTYTRRPQIHTRAKLFIQNYEQLARSLGFSGLAKRVGTIDGLVPERLRRG